MIQSRTARTRRYNARPPSHPVERVVTMHPHKASTNRCTKGRHRVRFHISGGWCTRNSGPPIVPHQTKTRRRCSPLAREEVKVAGPRSTNLKDAGPPTGTYGYGTATGRRTFDLDLRMRLATGSNLWWGHSDP